MEKEKIDAKERALAERLARLEAMEAEIRQKEKAMKQQEKSPFPYTLCLSDGNGTECYLPTEKEIPYGGYEVESFKRQRVFAFRDDTDKRIVAENQRLLQKLAE